MEEGGSIIGVDDGRLDHFDPFGSGLGFKVVGFLLVGYREDFPVHAEGSIPLQQNLSLLLPVVSLVVHQLGRRVQDQHPLAEVAKEHLLLYHSRQQHLISLLAHYVAEDLLPEVGAFCTDRDLMISMGASASFDQSIPLKKGWPFSDL
jgi:hypothetical protein